MIEKYLKEVIFFMSNIRPSLISDMDKCSCKGNNLDKLIQPIILTLLKKGKLHGYKIIQELEDKSLFLNSTPDNTGVYRTLHSLEKRKLVTSDWDTLGGGAAKKIYCLTEEGSECLENWIDTLEQYNEIIKVILKDAKALYEK